MPALSNVPSCSSHPFGRPSRNPGGGGPLGVALRAAVVEKSAVVGFRLGVTVDTNALGRPRASIINDFELAIVGAGCPSWATLGEVWQEAIGEVEKLCRS